MPLTRANVVEQLEIFTGVVLVTAAWVISPWLALAIVASALSLWVGGAYLLMWIVERFDEENEIEHYEANKYLA